ncbi:hypothetical protein J4526_03695 [Desulfurococcaceae archaeon MEX13E-LK6-19]|nr:hypothetical protein J4526_03695 [Desulfurococcaceae archaeon MEX13E-LK6-19]
MSVKLRLAVGVVLVGVGLGFLIASIYLMYIYHVMASLFSAILGFTVTSLGIDMIKEKKPV